MIRIPNKNKQFSVDNASFSRGNIYSTWNVMFDADIGKIKLNPPLQKLLSTTDDAAFKVPFSVLVAQKNGGGALDAYILAYLHGTFKGVWSTYANSLTRLTGTDAPSTVTDTTSDMCFFNGAITVSDSVGLHYVDDDASAGGWTKNTNAAFQGKFILIPYADRLYLFNSSTVVSCDTAYTPATSGSYTIATGLANITCARASSKRIWFASSGENDLPESKIYEWDGVQVSPLNTFIINTPDIQTIVILNDIPVAIDGRGNFWFYDGYQFVLKTGINIPAREDDFNTTCKIHRNGAITLKGKIYALVASRSDALPNTSERALAGIWCYDPMIGLYHFSSPDNCSRIEFPYALAKGTNDQRFIAGYQSGTGSITDFNSRIAVTETDAGLSGEIRTGFITTQFMESQNLTDMWNSVGIKYRKMIDPDAKIEVKYRFNKNIEANGGITWTGATTFTVDSTSINGAGTFCTPVVVGDEVMVQEGTNAGLIAHITTIVVAGVTTTITIDRSATTTSGTAYAMFSNFTLLGTITNDGDTYKNFRLAKKSTMIQVKLVMTWKGYYDEVQEILLSEQKQDSTI